jgi:lysozyme family protein
MPAKTADQLIAELIAREGGYSNNAADRGGPTKYGITEKVARANGYQGDMRDFPLATAQAIYRKLYWTGPRFDEVAKIAPRLAAELFDTGVNMGVGAASAFLQRALNALNCNGAHYPDMPVDGRIGGVTLNALDRFLERRGASVGEAVLVKACDCLQGEKYIAICEANPTQEVFAFGWLLNRIGQA